MKKSLLVFIFALFIACSSLHAQYCGTTRYDSEVFPNVTVTSDVSYGSNKDAFGTTRNLVMDIYQPTGDVDPKRPLIVFAHGGSFIGGTKTDADQVALCTRFAKRGYVTASIYYRILFYPFDEVNAKAAVWRATQDMKAAVRFFRKDAATANTYKIDSNMVFVGGYSAGCFMALHLAYLDQPSEVPSNIDTVALGGLEGNSGNPGYSSKVNAVLNLAGALGDTSWIIPGDIPCVTIQGNNDNTVPYCTAIISVSGSPIMPVSGGGTINTRMKNLGIYNPMHTFYGQDHGAPVSPAANSDTTIQLASDFLFKYMGCNPVNTVNYTNPQTCVLTAIHEFESEGSLQVYPVPATNVVRITISNDKGLKLTAELFDLSGRLVETYSPNQNEFSINRNGKDAGVYFLKMESETGKTQMAKIIWTN